MKAEKTKDGKLKIKVKKLVINDYKDKDAQDKKADRQFGQALRNSKAPANMTLLKESDRKLIRSPLDE